MIENRDCAAIDEMLPAYAVNGLDEADRALVEAHLLSCDRHADSAVWGAVALRLADLAPAIAPPEGLRARILAIPHAAADPVATTEPIVTDETAAPVEVVAPVVMASETRVPTTRSEDSDRSSRTPTPIRSFRMPYALAAAFAGLAVFFAGWTALLLTGDSGSGTQAALVASTAEGGIEARASYIGDEQVALVRFDGLPPLPAGSDYQLWAIGPGAAPTPAGILNTDGGRALSSVAGQFESGWTFAVTVEPEGGSPAPTSDPIVALTF